MLRLIWLSMAVILLFGGAKDSERPLDRVLLRSGKEIKGHVLVDRGPELVIGNGRKRTKIEREDVSEVVSAWRAMPEYLERYLQANREGSRGWTELASWCDQVGLEREAVLAGYRALLYEDNPQGVHEQLGSRKRKQTWSIPWGREWLELDEWRDREPKSWGAAPVLESSFFRLRSNDSVLGTLVLLGDLQAGHLGWFRLFGDRIAQEHRVDLFEINLHGDRKSYKRHEDGPPAYYSFDDDRIEIDGLRPRSAHVAYHEVSHQLLAEARRQRSSAADGVPAWIDEGLAEVLARVLAARSGFDASKSWLMGSRHFKVLRDAEEPPRIEDLFRLTRSEFHGGDEPDVPYSYAYTLVAVAFGEEHSMRRERFFEFLNRVLDGEAGSSDLASELGISQDELIREWHESVRPSEPQVR